MHKLLYHLENVKCRYEKTQYPVLEVKSMDIERGSVVFIVGSSGIGKSTILETLGLMTDTLEKNEDSVFKFYYQNGEIENIRDLWKLKEKEIAKFRRKHLSFIFQNTNLFSRLSGYKNIGLPFLLQGVSKSKADNEAKKILDKIAPNLDGNKKVVNMSGGEQHRIAFARSVVCNFTVLFADEPTGNLDMANADKLMNSFMDSLKEDERTAIIVTHNIQHAIKFADKIIFIEKRRIDNSRRYGEINKEATYIRNRDFRLNRDTQITEEELYKKLRDKLNANGQV